MLKNLLAMFRTTLCRNGCKYKGEGCVKRWALPEAVLELAKRDTSLADEVAASAKSCTRNPGNQTNGSRRPKADIASVLRGQTKHR